MLNKLSEITDKNFQVKYHSPSLVLNSELNGVQGVEGSNPFIPTSDFRGLQEFLVSPF